MIVGNTKHVNTFFLPRIDLSSVLVASFLCLAVSIGFIFTSDKFVHWFLIPTTLCGIAIGTDAVNWVRQRVPLFDPRGLLGVFGLHFFFLAPLLHINWDYQLLYLRPLEDWRAWFGYMSTLNLIGLCAYQTARRLIRSYRQNRYQTVWRLNSHLALIGLYFGMLFTGLLQFIIFWQFGGIEGFARASPQDVRGWGWIFTFSESFPLLMLFAFVIFARDKPLLRTWAVIGIVIAIFFVIRLLFFGGLSGSRSSTLYAMIWAICVIHFYLRPVPRQLIHLGIALAIVFMYLGGLYKSYRVDFLQIIQDEGIESIPRLLEDANRGVEEVLIEDLGRVSVQTYMLYRLTEELPYEDFEYAYGRTYVVGLLAPIPSAIFPNRPTGRVELGTIVIEPDALLYGGTSSRIYALAGEAMLNFGWPAVPFMFGIWGLIVGLVCRWLTVIPQNDTRILLFPMLIVVCFLFLTADLDLNIIYLVRQGLVPFVILWFSSRKGLLESNSETITKTA
jgi:hypothetical protein